MQTINQYINTEYAEISFTPKQEEAICNGISKDVIVKLELVKTCMDLIIKFANWYSMENDVPFNQLVQIGIIAVIKAGEKFADSKADNFADYISQEIMKAMIEFTK